MEKTISLWTVRDLWARFHDINFPEYQREPNLWSLADKRRLIDSIVRQFDIASLYFYKHKDEVLDCVDGRQRIGAIMAFLGDNLDDPNNRFPLRLMNDLSDADHDDGHAAFDGKTFKDIQKAGKEGNKSARELVDLLLGYQISVVELAASRAPEEFNLQFTRLNLGTILNSGEKLNAMAGEMRDECFGPSGLGHHPFLGATDIPIRRFAREQVTAQILAQVFSLKYSEDFRRTRHFDLQNFFKDHRSLNGEQRSLVGDVHNVLDLLHEPFEDSRVLRNRAITVSTVLLARKVNIATPDEAREFQRFIEEFQCRLNWQIKKGLDIDDQYRHLADFQRHMTQASAEKPAYTQRAGRLETEYDLWQRSGELTGDAEWKRVNPGRDPSAESRSSSPRS